MFSLVKFHNNEYCVVPSKNVKNVERKNTVVKYKGGSYSAFFVAKNDDRSILEKLKRKTELTMQPQKESKFTVRNYKPSSHSPPMLKTASQSHDRLCLLFEGKSNPSEEAVLDASKTMPTISKIKTYERKKTSIAANNKSSSADNKKDEKRNKENNIKCISSDPSTSTLILLFEETKCNTENTNCSIPSHIHQNKMLKQSNCSIPSHIHQNEMLKQNNTCTPLNQDLINKSSRNNIGKIDQSCAIENNNYVLLFEDEVSDKVSPNKLREKSITPNAFLSVADNCQLRSSVDDTQKLSVLFEDVPTNENSNNYYSTAADNGEFHSSVADNSKTDLLCEDYSLHKNSLNTYTILNHDSTNKSSRNNIGKIDQSYALENNNYVLLFEDEHSGNVSPNKFRDNLFVADNFQLQPSVVDNQKLCLLYEDVPSNENSPSKSVEHTPIPNNTDILCEDYSMHKNSLNRDTITKSGQNKIDQSCDTENNIVLLFEDKPSDNVSPNKLRENNTTTNDFLSVAEYCQLQSSVTDNQKLCLLFEDVPSNENSQAKSGEHNLTDKKISGKLRPPDVISTKTSKLNEFPLKKGNFVFPRVMGPRNRSLSLDCSILKRNIDFEKSINIMNKQELSFSKVNFTNQLECLQNESMEKTTNAEIEGTFSEYRDESSYYDLVTFNLPQTHNSTRISEIRTGSENLPEISSANTEDSGTSEYVIESTAETSIENSNTQANDKSLDIIDVPIDITKITVPYSKNKPKKHFCVFCHTLQSKISRHIFLKHKNEKEVKRAKALPAKSTERLKIIACLRKRGDFLHNTSVDHNSGILIVPRRQQSKFKNLADDYICCKKCKGFFSKKTLRIHLSKCYKSKNSRSNLIEGRRLTQFVHSVANDVLKCKVFPTLRNDSVTKAIRYDELIIKFGNKLTEKYSAQHQHDLIRANLRLLGRFKMQLIKLEPDVKELKDIFKPQTFDKCIKAVRATAKWDDGIMGFKTPAVAQHITSLIKKCGKKQRAELIKEENEEMKAQLENFLLLWEEETPTLINKKALEDQISIKRDKKVVMPNKEDIHKLYSYLKSAINNAIEVLMSGFRMSIWTELVQKTLILMQIFNRRRAGEIERLTIDNLVNKECITDTFDKDMFKSLSKESIKFAKQFVRITMRGKLGRTVSVLLCPLSIKAVELILKHRSAAGITKHNNFVFSKPTTSKLAKQYYRACPLLKRFSEECGAKIPESLRGTHLRKHIATYTALLNVEDAAIDKLANFMGHHKDIHKNIYRLSVPIAEITCVSKLLIAAIGDEEEVEDDNISDSDDDDEPCGKFNAREKILNEDIEINSFDKENSGNSFEGSMNSTSSSRKRRSTSPFGKTKRVRWNNNEKAAILSEFGDIKALESLPSLKQCLSAITKHPALKKRTPQQVKSWVDNQRRYEKN